MLDVFGRFVRGKTPLYTLLLAAGSTLAQTSAAGLTADTVCNSNLCLNAIYDASAGLVNYTMTADSGGSPIGWYAVGTGLGMAGSDMMIGWVSSTGTPIMSQRTAPGHVPPSTQITAKAAMPNNLRSFSNSSGTAWSWSIPVSSSSSFMPSTQTPFIWAINPSNNPGDSPSSALRQHSHFGRFQLDLTKPYTPQTSGQTGNTPVTPSTSGANRGASSGGALGPLSRREKLIVVHLIFMTLAFLVVSPIAVLVGRWGRTLLSRWYPWHQNLQLSAVAFVIVGFSVIVYVESLSSPAQHFSDTHGRIGLAVFILVLLQALLGFVGHKATARFHPLRILHVVAGLTTLGLAFYNLGSGFGKFSYRTSTAAKYIVWGVGFGGFGAAYLLGLVMLPRDLKAHRQREQGRAGRDHIRLEEKTSPTLI